MANVKLCDRCGKRVDNILRPVVMTPVQYSMKLETPYFSYEYDLCKDCGSKLSRFMDGAELMPGHSEDTGEDVQNCGETNG